MSLGSDVAEAPMMVADRAVVPIADRIRRRPTVRFLGDRIVESRLRRGRLTSLIDVVRGADV